MQIESVKCSTAQFTSSLYRVLGSNEDLLQGSPINMHAVFLSLLLLSFEHKHEKCCDISILIQNLTIGISNKELRQWSWKSPKGKRKGKGNGTCIALPIGKANLSRRVSTFVRSTYRENSSSPTWDKPHLSKERTNERTRRNIWEREREGEK